MLSRRERQRCATSGRVGDEECRRGGGLLRRAAVCKARCLGGKQRESGTAPLGEGIGYACDAIVMRTGVRTYQDGCSQT